jgi:mRNA interferase RelE/StbE
MPPDFIQKWSLEFLPEARRDFAKLGTVPQKRIMTFLEDRLLMMPTPTDLGKPLSGTKKGLWRYRVGDYRILCRFDSGILTILVVEIGHRGSIYR